MTARRPGKVKDRVLAVAILTVVVSATAEPRHSPSAAEIPRIR